ncbi:Structural maintenance of chromosomes protein 2-1 [Tetrabaena socialis]|uniref:Structural maintenance of chromosomes protein 2-1 n=1 Tax=Tetrabaena socialis TaxID=47790 RepID=A0A2J8A9Q6_9CHLO|nr:Structural maintenance of chromosomes protein 2-1 [Tetrabaena socialis]|eukprot:PNH09256.1 Structural maintenance of chromosomes protein 2-1 [Tetrabaena socialis]
MYISEVCIEGFKSYANRVTLSNFDENFNAITGLNGSGKSNILDSICFVLGIRNLSQVRAANLQDLVYKQGQAGISKATVSITFCNSDPKKGPTGFEDKETITVTRQVCQSWRGCGDLQSGPKHGGWGGGSTTAQRKFVLLRVRRAIRAPLLQVVIAGRNKYLINGHAATETLIDAPSPSPTVQVVVDDDATAKELLQKGQLRRRVTIIPLNKVSYPQMHPSVAEAAARLSGGRARPALELLQFDPRVAPAVQYAFANVFICQDAGTAKKLAFSREVNMRCVTLEGDDFNPSGTLTGGSRGNRACTLLRLAELAAAREALADAGRQLAEVEAQLGGVEAVAREHTKCGGIRRARLSKELALAQHSLGLAQARVAGSEGAQLAAAADATEAQLAAAKEAGKEAAAKKKELVELAKVGVNKTRQRQLRTAKARYQGWKGELERRRG